MRLNFKESFYGTAALAVLFLFVQPLASASLKDFQPAWWCRGGDAQTICGGIFRHPPKISYRRERLDLPDGDFVDLDWADGNPGTPVVVIFHGLASSSGSPYIKTLIAETQKKGWRGVVMNARGQSGEPNRLKGTHNAGRSQDVGWTVQHVINVLSSPHALSGDPKSLDSRFRGNDNKIKIYLVGYSIGGNILLKWLGETGDAVPAQVKKAAAVSVPYDLEKTAEHLDKPGINRGVYTHLMLKVLIPLALEKEKRFPGILNYELVEHATTFKVYDREVTAHLNGFKDEIEYWHQSSSKNYLAGIRVPTLLIHAANDPFLPGEFVPVEEMKKNPKLQLLLTSDGGHLGFVSGKWPGQMDSWLEDTILEYVGNTE